MSFFEPGFNFMRLPDELATYENSYFVLLSSAYDGTTSYVPGTRKGPMAIIEASKNIEWYDMEIEKNPSELGIYTSPQIEVNTSGPDFNTENVYKATASLINREKFVIGLGGEHSVSWGYIKAHKELYGDFSILHFDAHSDVRLEWEGAEQSHACVIKNTYNNGLKNIVSVGIRSMDIEEKHFLDNSSIVTIPAWEVHQNFEKSVQKIVENLKNDKVYITFDVDVFDISQLWDTGTPEPGGLFWNQIIHILKTVFESKNVIGADVVELIGNEPSNASTVAKLVYRIMGYKLCQKN